MSVVSREVFQDSLYPPDRQRKSVAPTIGFYIPVPKRANQSERDAMLDAGRRMQEELIRLGITEDELVADFKDWRRSRDAV
jgi:hypothetical protein